MILFTASWFTDSITEFFYSLINWVVNFAQNIFGFDLSVWDILVPLKFIDDSVAFANSFLPFIQCFEILLAGFAVKTGVMLARHIIGWIPTVDG